MICNYLQTCKIKIISHSLLLTSKNAETMSSVISAKIKRKITTQMIIATAKKNYFYD